MKNNLFVYGGCIYFRKGLSAFLDKEFQIIYFNDIIDLYTVLSVEQPKHINVILVLNLSVLSEFVKFNTLLTLLKGDKRVKIGILLNKLTSYLSYYFFMKLNGKVHFFDAENAKTGGLCKDVKCWFRSGISSHIRPVYRFYDKKYKIPLMGWISLVIPLCGESINDIKNVLGVNKTLIYQARYVALSKLKMRSYKQFCHLFFQGSLKIEILPPYF